MRDNPISRWWRSLNPIAAILLALLVVSALGALVVAGGPALLLFLLL